MTNKYLGRADDVDDGRTSVQKIESEFFCISIFCLFNFLLQRDAVAAAVINLLQSSAIETLTTKCEGTSYIATYLVGR